MLRLRVQPPEGEPYDFEHPGDALVIGRSSVCDLALEDRFLSRRHARLFRSGDRFLVEDLGSRNGTLLNGRRIAQATIVSPGDRIELSTTEIYLEEIDGRRAAVGLGTSAIAGMDGTIFRPASDLLALQAPSATTSIEGEEGLRRRAGQLAVVNEAHADLSRSLSVEDLLNRFLQRIFDHLGPEEGAIFLRRPDGSTYRAASHREPGFEEEVLYSQTLISEVIDKGLSALSLDIAGDERFAEARSMIDAGVRSLLAAPLLTSDGALGMIVLSSRVRSRRFTAEDLDLLTSLASAAGLRLQNLSLQEEAAERRRLQQELALARRIQEALLPSALPDLPGYRLHAESQPSRGVSGDLFQLQSLPALGRALVLVADVSGKGIAASLLTAAFEALAAGLVAQGLPPAELLGRLGTLLHARTPPEKYATCFLAELELASGRLLYASGGHNAALLLRASGEVETLGSTGVPVGLVPGAVYRSEEVVLDGGDSLVVYTDGITEAEDAAGEEYGLERLIEVVKAAAGLPATELAREIIVRAEEFVGGLPFVDDRTLVVVQRA